ncbi:MAG: tetratricopeptide repeat protein [Candidatus Delongbacteria bacterium]|nr:tetratricopeptide repeat protein [Candidatus Delongbacteria bacterium]
MKRSLIGIILLFAIVLIYAQEKDSLENLINTASGDQKIGLLIQLAEKISTDNSVRAIELLEEAQGLAVEYGKIDMKAKIHYEKGNLLFDQSKYVESVDEYRSSLKIYEELLDKPMIITLTKEIGQSYYQLSDYNNALIFFYKSLKYADNISDNFSRAEALNDIGLVFDEMKDYDKALENLNEALDIYRSLLNIMDVAKVLNNISVVYSHQGKLDEALNNLKKVLKIYENEKLEHYQAIIMNNMSDIYIELGKFNEAVKNLRSASAIFKKVNDNYGLGLTDHNYGKAYFITKKFVTAKKYLNKSKKAFEEMGVKVMVRNNLQFIIKADSASNNFKNAFSNLQEYNRVNSEILDSEKEHKIAELEKKYNLEQKEKQLYSQIRDNQYALSNLEKQKSINNFFLIIFLLSVLVLYFVYRSYKLKSTRQELLNKYSLEIEALNKKLNEEIKITTDKLNESNEKLLHSEKDASRLDKMVSLGTLLAGITHEIRNPSQVIKLSLDNIRLSLNDLTLFIYDLIKVKTTDKKVALEIKKLVKKHEISRVFNDLKSLVNSNKKSIGIIEQIVNSTSKMSYFSREYTPNSVNEIIKDVLILVKNNIKYNATVDLDLHPRLPLLRCNYQEIAQILFNLLSNAKDAISQKGLHSDQGVIRISTKFENKNIILEIEDNGYGINESDIGRIFDSFYTTKEMGKGLGLGLSIVKSIVEDYKGAIDVRSKMNEGTIFRISFPTVEDVVIERDSNTFNNEEFLTEDSSNTDEDDHEGQNEESEYGFNKGAKKFEIEREDYPDENFFDDDDIYK